MAAGAGIGRMGRPSAGRSAAGLGSSENGAPGWNNCTTALPLVFAMSWSSGLRSTSWMVVWLLARLNISACSGVTSRLTTGTETGFPSASFWKFCPAESTSTFCSRVSGDCAQRGLRPGGLPDISTSTRMPGPAKPATPTISFTRMATARMPVGDHGRQARSAAFGGQAAFHYGFAGEDGRNHAAPDDILFLLQGAFRYGSGPISVA